MSEWFLFSVVEDLFRSREPVPEMKAIYFMSPTAKVFILFNHVEKNSLQNEIYNFHFVVAVSFCYNVFDCSLIKIF